MIKNMNRETGEQWLLSQSPQSPFYYEIGKRSKAIMNFYTDVVRNVSLRAKSTSKTANRPSILWDFSESWTTALATHRFQCLKRNIECFSSNFELIGCYQRTSVFFPEERAFHLLLHHCISSPNPALSYSLEIYVWNTKLYFHVLSSEIFRDNENFTKIFHVFLAIHLVFL